MKNEDIEFLNELILSIQKALTGEVIPSLRRVRLDWNPGEETAIIAFYHHGEISDTIKEHYSSIYAKVTDNFVFENKVDFTVIRIDYPNPLPSEKYTIYARKEPFVDPA